MTESLAESGNVFIVTQTQQNALLCLASMYVCIGLLAKVSAKTAWGFTGNAPPALQRFAVELDQRFLTELAHTAALFGELFEVSGRKQLLKVSVACNVCL